MDDDPEALLQKQIAAYEQMRGTKPTPEFIAAMRKGIQWGIAKATVLQQATPEELEIYKANLLRRIAAEKEKSLSTDEGLEQWFADFERRYGKPVPPELQAYMRKLPPDKRQGAKVPDEMKAKFIEIVGQP